MIEHPIPPLPMPQPQPQPQPHTLPHPISQPQKPNIDRTVTLGLVLTLMIQTASALHWAGAVEARVELLEIRAKQTLPINTRLTRMEEQVIGIRRTLTRIEVDLNDGDYTE